MRKIMVIALLAAASAALWGFGHDVQLYESKELGFSGYAEAELTVSKGYVGTLTKSYCSVGLEVPPDLVELLPGAAHDLAGLAEVV